MSYENVSTNASTSKEIGKESSLDKQTNFRKFRNLLYMCPNVTIQRIQSYDKIKFMKDFEDLHTNSTKNN